MNGIVKETSFFLNLNGGKQIIVTLTIMDLKKELTG